MQEHFNVRWGDPTLYDLTLNTERVPIAQCVEQVVALARSAAFQETPASRQYLADLALQARARAVLRSDERTAAIDVDIEVRDGEVTLRGIVVDDREKRLCEEVLRSLPGAKGFRDELRTMTAGLYRFPTSRKEV
jgi:osmotically-inducible protein OsmY